MLVMLSGGGDSVCLLDVCLRLGAEVSALHVNYGLREGADADEAFCRGAVRAAGGAAARSRRCRCRRRATSRPPPGRPATRPPSATPTGDYAAGHTASDQAETVLYRLATSPGRRALLGMEPRRGRLVRPLLRATREEVRDYLRGRGLEWREDPSNADRRFARSRAREELVPALRSLGPAAERNVAETALLLREEAEVLDAAVDEVLGAARRRWRPPAWRELQPALARLVLRRLAGTVAVAGRGRPHPRPGPSGGLAVARPGRRAAGGERIRGASFHARARGRGSPAAGGADRSRARALRRVGGRGLAGGARGGVGALGARLHRALAGATATACARSGSGGTKSLQDLFTDRKVPRALRRALPVVCAGEEVVWVAGVALDERWAADDGPVGLSARQVA